MLQLEPPSVLVETPLVVARKRVPLCGSIPRLRTYSPVGDSLTIDQEAPESALFKTK